MHRAAQIVQHFEDTKILFYNCLIVRSSDPLDESWGWMVISIGRVIMGGPVETQPPLTQYSIHHNLDGCTILPGLIDSHIHIRDFGKGFFSVNCRVSSIHELQHAVVIHHQQSSQGWIVGHGWEQGILGRYPNRHDIDKVVNTVPVILWRVCLHVCVLNTFALNMLGIDRDSPTPSGGVIDRTEDGELTGILRENAVSLVEKYIRKKETVEIRTKYIQKGLNEAVALGLTAVQTNDSYSWPIYKKLASAGKLPLRVFLTPVFDEIDEKRSNYQKDSIPKPGEVWSPLLSSHRIKLFADGALGSETAALSKPYFHKENKGMKKCNHKGVLIHTTQALREKVAYAHNKGWRIELHVIGDCAAEQGLDAFTNAGISPNDRPILTHCQVLRPDLIKRMADQGVVANIQPQFVTTDSAWVEARLDPSLLASSYAWKTLLMAGIKCAGGSDAPVEFPDPFLGIYAAMFRPARNKDKKNVQVQPEQVLSQEEALHLYTIGGAYACGMENKLGKLHEGYYADFVVVDQKAWNQPNLDHKIKPKEVWVEGIRRI